MRQLSSTNKKIRGTKRRLKSFKAWTDSFENYFTDKKEYDSKEEYWRLPVLSSFVEGKVAKLSVQKEIIKLLLNACDHLVNSKNKQNVKCRIVVVITWPYLHASQLCIYYDDKYFNTFINESINESINEESTITRIENKSLVNMLGVKLNNNYGETGINVEFHSLKNNCFEHHQFWYLGEVNNI